MSPISMAVTTILIILVLGVGLFVPPAGAASSEPQGCNYGIFSRDAPWARPAFTEQTRAPSAKPSSSYRVDVVAGRLSHPWALAFLPDGSMLVTEREGRLRWVDTRGQVSPPIKGLPPIKKGPPGGLWDLVLDPDFLHTRWVYFNYFSPAATPVPTEKEAEERWEAWLKLTPAMRRQVDEGEGHVARAVLATDNLHLERVVNLMSGVLDGRLRFLRDDTLVITSGTPASVNSSADGEPQDLSTGYGKILRIRADGSIPADNPFMAREGARQDIWAYGLRDPQGLAIDSQTGELWTSEHGPRGGDAIHRIRRGDNLGYPIISYGREYSGAAINGGLTRHEGMVQPVYFWSPDIAPSGMTFYEGNAFPKWRGNLLVAALAGKRLERLVLEGGRVVAQEPLLVERCQRLRAVYQGRDGALYVLTDEDAGEILRVSPTS